MYALDVRNASRIIILIALLTISDRATQLLNLDGCFVDRAATSLRQAAGRGGVLRTTLQHCARGRRSLQEKAAGQQYLRPCEETALVRFLLQQNVIGQPVRIKHVRSIACSLACQRSSTEKPSKPPGKNWSHSFCKRHVDVLKAGKSSAMDWNRFNINDKVV